MKYHVSNWDLKSFNALKDKASFPTDISITQAEIDSVKIEILRKINKFMVSAGFIEETFTRHGATYTHEDVVLERDLLQEIYSFGQVYFDKRINIHNIAKFFGINTLDLTKALKGKPLGSKTIEAILSKLMELYKGELSWTFGLPEDVVFDVLTDRELRLTDAFSNLFSEISTFAVERGLTLFNPEFSQFKNEYDSYKWNDERVKGYQVVFHLTQFLGFDPLFLEPLSKSIFTNGRFQRHHFRDWILRKTSSAVGDVLLTDIDKHPTYEKYSEGYIVAIMNSIIETISMKKAEITEADLRKSLEKHMEKYLKESGGNTKEGNSVSALVDKVFSIWKKNGQSQFKEHIDKLNFRRKTYLAKKDYAGFLKNEYDMDKNSRFLKNAQEFHVLLRNEEISGSTRDLFATQADLDYMQRIFNKRGSSQTLITDYIYVFSTESSDNINVEYINYLEQRIFHI